MKNYAKIALAGALMLAFQANAQVTNLVQTINFTMTAYFQTSETDSGKAAVNTKTIISILGLELDKVFSEKAKLIVKRDASDIESTGQVFVRETANKVNTDTAVPPEILTETIVRRILDVKVNESKGTVTGKAFTADSVTLNAASGTFDVSGFITEQISTVSKGGNTFQVRSGTLKASGTGTYFASPTAESVDTVLTGTIQLSGKTLEVESD